MTEPMSAERLAETAVMTASGVAYTIEMRLAEIEEMHVPYNQDGAQAYCDDDERPWPCPVIELLHEVRRLQRENRLLHLSRGSAALVGMD